MRTHIDWLTFTMSPRWVQTEDIASMGEAYSYAMERAFYETFGEDLVKKAFGGSWEKQQHSRAPYTDCWQLGEDGITVFASPVLTHMCVEISGYGCGTLIERGLLGSIVSLVKERVTRIDIASDIETDVRPSEFVSVLSHARMRASGYQISETGETQYVGSKKSDRYARIYRYNAPHPRSHLLRVEHVFRKGYAKIVAEQIADQNIEAIARAAGKVFGWQHAVWTPDSDSDLDISIHGEDKRGNNTVYWLVNTCAPSFRKLVEKGIIENPMQFLERYFLGEE